jgi:hypothetical protein
MRPLPEVAGHLLVDTQSALRISLDGGQVLRALLLMVGNAVMLREVVTAIGWARLKCSWLLQLHSHQYCMSIVFVHLGKVLLVTTLRAVLLSVWMGVGGWV